jgi:hypothetical protein
MLRITRTEADRTAEIGRSAAADPRRPALCSRIRKNSGGPREVSEGSLATSPTPQDARLQQFTADHSVARLPSAHLFREVLRRL